MTNPQEQIGQHHEPSACDVVQRSNSPACEMSTADFLNLFGPHHVLCAFRPSGGPPVCSEAGAPDEVIAWAKKKNDAGLNIYFHVNTVRPGFIGKARKTDITHIVSVQSDLDWGWKDYEGRFQERMDELAAQQQVIRAGSTPPSVSVFTGGGYHHYYLLDEPLENTPENQAITEAIVQRFVALWGSDMVGNADRIMRLPGFLNYPKPQKAAAGQPVVLARVLP